LADVGQHRRNPFVAPVVTAAGHLAEGRHCRRVKGFALDRHGAFEPVHHDADEPFFGAGHPLGIDERGIDGRQALAVGHVAGHTGERVLAFAERDRVNLHDLDFAAGEFAFVKDFRAKVARVAVEVGAAVKNQAAKNEEQRERQEPVASVEVGRARTGAVVRVEETRIGRSGLL